MRSLTANWRRCSRKRHIRWLLNKPSALFGLGIPPSQFEALKGDEQYMSKGLLERLERLACDFDLADNYFAWQAFGRRYSSGGSGPLPPYLQRENYDNLKERIDGLEIQHRSFTEYLEAAEDDTIDAYVLLDAQDWMTDDILIGLWREIARTSRPGARVIFRTAGEESILPGRVPEEILSQFAYDAEKCRAWTKRDRSSIYGGFPSIYLQGGLIVSAGEGHKDDHSAAAHGQHMDGIYRYQRYIYDATRKYYLLGRDRMLDGLRPPPGRHDPRGWLRHRAQSDPGRAPLSAGEALRVRYIEGDAGHGARVDRAGGPLGSHSGD